MISIEFDTKGMERILSPLAGLPKEITKALKLAARRTGQSLRSDIRKGVRAESYLRGGDIGKAFGVLEVKGRYCRDSVFPRCRGVAPRRSF